MKTSRPMDGSGKTHFNRIKKPGQSWVTLRDEAIKRGTYNPGKAILSRIRGMETTRQPTERLYLLSALQSYAARYMAGGLFFALRARPGEPQVIRVQ